MDARTAGFVLLLVGLALVVNPVTLWPHYGEDAYGMHVWEGVEPESGEEVIESESLSPDAASALDAHLEGEAVLLYSERDRAAVQTFREGTVIRSEQSSHYVFLSQRSLDPPLLPQGTANLRWGLPYFGAMLLTVGGLMVAGKGWQPVTPRNAWLFVGTVSAAIVATHSYDHGALTLDLFPRSLIPGVGVVIGSAWARGRWDGQRGLEAAVVFLFAVATLAIVAHSVLLGYFWTAERSADDAERAVDGESTVVRR